MRLLVCCLILVLVSLVGLAGCTPGGPTLYNVEGKVTVNGKAVDQGDVALHAADGNSSGWVGGIMNGTYLISASPGKYKVTVSQMDMDDDSPKPQVRVNPRYADVSKTDLMIEVVASPADGAYDLKLSE